MVHSERQARILWRCRRGMLELDLLLQWFLKNHGDVLTDDEWSSFEALLTLPDPDLYHICMGHQVVEQREWDHIVALIQSHARFSAVTEL